MQDAPPPISRARADRARGPDHDATRLERLIVRSRLALAWERVWPALWWPAAIVAAFLVVSWLGLWTLVPAQYRIIGVGILVMAFAASLWPLVRVSWPSRAAALNRLDRDAPVANRPASTFDDTLAMGQGDPATVALWEVHRQRARAALEKLRVAAPSPGMANRDRHALRAIPILALIAAAFIAGPEVTSRLMLAFDWRNAPAAGPAFRIDGWIDPPLYTRVPPLMLDFARNPDAPLDIRVPVKSTLVLRFAGQGGIKLSPGPGLEALPVAAAPAPGIEEHRFTLTGSTRLTLEGPAGTRSLTIAAIPDRAPQIRLSGEPENTRRGSLTLRYRVSDDYGIASAEAVFERENGNATRSLVPPPNVPLALPADPAADQDTETVADLSSHAWAGARLKMTLVAKDEAGQEGRSSSVMVTLPQRPFTKPLARALVEQRRNLIMAPDDARRVRTALQALMIAPEDFTPSDSQFLGLSLADKRLAGAKSDEDLLEVAEFLWTMALQIEDGDLSQAERDLRAAQEALRQALERGASPEEIARLTQELRQALNRFLNEFAQQQMRQQQQGQQSPGQQRQQPSRTITQDDLNRMLDRMEQMARQGAMADAQNLLDQMRDILENLQGSRQAGNDPMSREMQRSLNELDQMIRDQQALRDDTFRQDGSDGSEMNQRQRGRNQQGQRQQGQRGQQGQMGQRGQNGQEGQGQEGMSGEELAQRQQALRERLEAMRRQLKGLGMQGEEGLDSAEGAMRDAEGQLGQGETGSALDSQGDALEALQRGAQGLAQQMQQEGEGQGNEQAGNGQPGRTGPNGQRDEDPLGRPTRNRDWSDGRVRIPTAEESATVRARRILDELRRRLGDQLRPQDELDYLERLLRNQ
ncbi:MAG: TIGR02302 family protein [Chelatococcus sp.]|uniref:TIGR02302 family protein n=1 Tax=Chelatococcus sp. TaxID=1953771 RepID=UPI0025C2BBB1|nr:TIGR02302 family protein [Chelatococcus sp.]MBX3536247.1 TIGR02302 family protein [Chelatococcus sp.]